MAIKKSSVKKTNKKTSAKKSVKKTSESKVERDIAKELDKILKENAILERQNTKLAIEKERLNAENRKTFEENTRLKKELEKSIKLQSDLKEDIFSVKKESEGYLKTTEELKKELIQKKIKREQEHVKKLKEIQSRLKELNKKHQKIGKDKQNLERIKEHIDQSVKHLSKIISKIPKISDSNEMHQPYMPYNQNAFNQNPMIGDTTSTTTTTTTTGVGGGMGGTGAGNLKVEFVNFHNIIDSITDMIIALRGTSSSKSELSKEMEKLLNAKEETFKTKEEVISQMIDKDKTEENENEPYKPDTSVKDNTQKAIDDIPTMKMRLEKDEDIYEDRLVITYAFDNMPENKSYSKYKMLLRKAARMTFLGNLNEGLEMFKMIRDQNLPEEYKEMIDKNISDITYYLRGKHRVRME